LRKTNKSAKADSTKQQNEQLGKAVTAIYETGYLDARKSLSMSFVKGVAGGMGGVIGATVGIAILLWVLSWFGQIPFLNEFVNKVEYTIKQEI
jgi:uncharacterized protein (DUF697 family)